MERFSELFVFDFDGVICDSAFEAFRIGATAAGLLNSPLSTSADNYYESFLGFRPKVGPAWNYYYVFQEILKLNSGDNNTNWSFSIEAEEFSKAFFNVRAQIKKSNNAEWLELHKPYEEVVDILNRTRIAPTIITNKNSDAVEQLLNNYNLKYANVISMTKFDQKLEKIDIINEKFPKSVFFIDDHVGTVDSAENKKFSTELSVRFASWGYGISPKHKLSITIGELEQCLTMTLQQLSLRD